MLKWCTSKIGAKRKWWVKFGQQHPSFFHGLMEVPMVGNRERPSFPFDALIR